MLPRHPGPRLFPYTTLFRSDSGDHRTGVVHRDDHRHVGLVRQNGPLPVWSALADASTKVGGPLTPVEMSVVAGPRVGRSEEHTSELQSQSNLVCRLLLEKKK